MPVACSRKCREALTSSVMSNIDCAHCGSPIPERRLKIQEAAGHSVFACSKSCRAKLSRRGAPKPKRVCPNCGLPFDVGYGKSRTCSKQCAADLDRLDSEDVDWQAFFKTADWQKVMDEVLAEPEDAA